MSLSDMTDQEVDELIEQYHVPEAMRERLRSEVKLSRAMRQECLAMAARIQAGETIQHDEVAAKLAEVAESMGCDMGIPMPDLEMGNQFISARNTPLGLNIQYMTRPDETEFAEGLRRSGARVINSWTQLGDQSISLVSDGQEVLIMTEPHAGCRLRKLMETMITRSQLPNMSAKAELAAMECLKEKLNVCQWDSYVLNGAFPERSARSDLHYIFRKGYPTLAVSYHNSPGGRVLAALCLHPIGYYAGTHCGSMTPSDEVIAHLLLMRADEHKFWARSGQWSAIDSRSGI